MGYAYGIRRLFNELFWPAAAGNVFWSVWTLLMKWEENASRILILLAMALYLSIEWLRNQRFPPKTKYLWIPFDLLHIWAVSFTAVIATLDGQQTLICGQPGLLWGLGAYFLITGIGHFAGAYVHENDPKHLRCILAFINFAGLLVLAFGFCRGFERDIWFLPASFGFVLALWVGFGRLAQLKDMLHKPTTIGYP